MKKISFCTLIMLLSCIQLLVASETGSGTSEFVRHNCVYDISTQLPDDELLASNQFVRTGSSKPQSIKKWVEDLGYGIVVNELFSDGKTLSMTYRRCPACNGTLTCGMCYGSGTCSLCHGRGAIYSVGYSFPCTICQGTGRCNICGGSGTCFCSQDDYPGYTYYSGRWIGPDGQILFNDSPSNYDGGNSSSPRSSSRGRNVCPVCNGRKYESQAYRYAAGAAAGWKPPYHHFGGSDCPYCNSTSDHYHYPCSECKGTGRK